MYAFMMIISHPVAVAQHEYENCHLDDEEFVRI